MSAVEECAELAPADVARQVSREKIERLESYLRNVPQVDLQTKHYISAGMYAREITIPAGTVLTGAAHKFDHLNICHGDIIVWTEDGMKRLTGHHTMASRAGAKRVGMAIHDTVWTTIHRTDETDIEKLEEMLTDEAERLQTRRLGLPQHVQELLEV